METLSGLARLFNVSNNVIIASADGKFLLKA